MTRVVPFACLLVAVGLVALSATTTDCSSCGGVPCLGSDEFRIESVACITSIESDCASKVQPCGDGGPGKGAAYVLGPEDGGTCNVTTTLDDGRTVAFQVSWSLHTAATKCCAAAYQADPPALTIGAADAGAGAPDAGDE